MPSSREVEPTADPGDWGNRSLVVTRHVSQPAPAPASSVPTVPQALDRPLPQGSTLSAPSATARSTFSLVGGDDHPLGPPDLWPEGLRTAVDICLASRFPMLVWWGPDLVMLYNAAYHPMLGTKHPRAFGAPGREVWPEIWDVIGPMLDQVMGGGGATWSTDQLLVLDRNGYPEECYFTYSYSPIPDESGGVGGVFCAVTETTERVVGERRLATVAELAHLIRAGQRSDVIETANVVLAGNPHDHPVALVVDRGPGTERADTETALSRFGLELTPGTRARLADLVRQVSGTGRRARVEADAEASAIGVKAWHAYPVPEPGAQQRGRATAVLLLGESVGRPWDGSLEAYAALCAGHVAGALTGVRELSEERRQHQALLELDEAKSAFFTNISHELRTPLTLMAGPVQDALAAEADPVQRRRLELVERGTHRLTRMVDAMLDFGRMEAGHLAPAPAPVDVAELTRALAESFRPAIERAGLGFAHSGDEATVDAVLDRDMYERIVLNLLSNALKYTPSGSVRLTLAVTDRELAVTVADTGVGIASRDLERVFARFERLPVTDGARSSEGAGIGLAMVRQLSELMGGSVAVESEVGRGSTFTVRVPLHVEAPGGGGVPSVTPRRVDDFLRETRLWEADASAEPPRTDPRPGSRPRLVVAEDNPDLRSYLGDVLGDLYDVELVADGRAAVEAVRREEPDLVVADVMMPGVGGYELVELIRAEPALAGVPVLLLSARAGASETSSGLGAGADDYLVKPFSVVELRARVASNLERAAARTRDSSWRRAVMESLHDALVITDPDGAVLEVNDGFTTILGWSADDGPFAPPYPWEVPPAADGLSGAELLRRALSSADDPDHSDHPEPLEGLLRHRDGHCVRVAARVSLVDGGRRRPSLVLCTLRDVTAEHEARQRRHAAALMGAELAAADELGDVLGTAVAGFGDLFDGEATVRVLVGGRDHVFTASGPLDPGALTLEVARALAADPAAPVADEPVPGILLVGGGPAPECRVWVDFPTPRRVAADERIAGDLLVGSLALACDRVVAASSFADRERHLRLAIQSHEEIAQAVGILVERHRWTPTAAFERIKRVSQDRNIKLREVARRVIESGADLDDAGDDVAGRRRR